MVPLAGRNTPCRRSENTIGCSIACRPCQPQSTQRRKVACFLKVGHGLGAWSAATSESNHTLFLEEAAGTQLKSQNFSLDMANCQLKPQDVALHKVSVGGPLGSVKPRSNALLSGQVVFA